MLILFGIIGVILLVLILTSIKVVNTGYVYIVERFGQYHRTLEPGWKFTIPMVDYVRKKVSTKQQILDIQPQSVITKDNVNISIDNVIFYRVLSPKDAIYNIEDFKSGIIYSTITNMRNIVGNMTLDEVLSGRDIINQELLKVVDDITDAYGIKVLSVEIKNIIPPAEIQQAMERQMKAERVKRQSIIEAEGSRQSQINVAEGEKQAKILKAEAEKEANIRRAEGLKESQLLEAEGKAKAEIELALAKAKAIEIVNKAIMNGTDEKVIALKQIEMMEKLANSPNSKIIIPTDTMQTLGSISTLTETIKMTKDDK